MTNGARLMIALLTVVGLAAIGGTVWYVNGVVNDWARSAENARREEKEKEERTKHETSLARRNQLIDTYYPTAPRRRAFAFATETPQPPSYEVKANSLRINSVSRPKPEDRRNNDRAALVLSVTNEGDKTVPFPFAWFSTVEDLTWDKPSEAMIKKSSESFANRKNDLGYNTAAIAPGQTADITINSLVPPTSAMSLWLTILVFKPDLVTDCECLVVTTASSLFYEYVPRP